jgi:hypothetical protein
MSIKTSNNKVGNRNRDLHVCSTVPQPTAAPRAPDGKLSIIRRSNVQCQITYV